MGQEQQLGGNENFLIARTNSGKELSSGRTGRIRGRHAETARPMVVHEAREREQDTREDLRQTCQSAFLLPITAFFACHAARTPF
jgi:hypothetical protein